MQQYNMKKKKDKSNETHILLFQLDSKLSFCQLWKLKFIMNAEHSNISYQEFKISRIQLNSTIYLSDDDKVFKQYTSFTYGNYVLEF